MGGGKGEMKKAGRSVVVLATGLGWDGSVEVMVKEGRGGEGGEGDRP